MDTSGSTVVEERLNAAERLARRLDRPMGILGFLFLFLQVLLAMYSVAVFATLASAVGAYFLRGDEATEGGGNVAENGTASPEADGRQAVG